MFNEEIIAKILDRDAEVKDIKWAQKMVSLIMLNAKEIISKTNYNLGKNILFGEFPEVNFDKLFVGDYMNSIRSKLTKNNTLHFFERIRNTIIDQRNQAGLTIVVNSLDPLKEEKKKYDRELLKNRKGIEGLLNEVTGNNGMPPTKVQPEDYHGNVEDFDAKSGNEFDTTELDTFFDMAWGLKDELHYQNAINFIYQVNDVVGEYDKYINDILICLHNFSQVYVDAIEGGVKIKPLYPYEVKVLHATGSNNFKDAQGFRIPKSTNIRDFMRMFGSHFDFANDWHYLLSAINGSTIGSDQNNGGTNGLFTGITEGGALNKQTGIKEGGMIIYGKAGKLIDFEAFLESPINYSYSEWKTMNKEVTQYSVTKEGNIIPSLVSSTNPRIDGCEVEETFSECTYYAYSIDTSIQTPKIIKWGKVYMQEFEGLEDEYSGFTIKGNKRDGIPMVEILKPFWNIINVTFKMLEVLINDIKPDGLLINFSSMIRIANELLKSTDTPTDQKKGIQLFLEMVGNSSNVITDNPETPEGDRLGGGSSGVTVNKKGLNDTAIDITKIIDWAEGKASLYTGTMGIEPLKPDDGYKVSLESKVRTRAATSFIDFILLDHLKDCSITCLNYVQDIAGFRDIPAYKYLECAIGYKAMEYIGKKEKSPHRYGTLIETFNNDIQLIEIRGRAAEALQKDQISLEQYLVLLTIKNPVQAGIYLAYERKKAEKKVIDTRRAELMGQDALEKKKNDYKIELENVKGKWRALAEDKRAAGFITASQQNSQATIVTKQIQEKGQNERLAADAINDIDKIAEQATVNAQQPVNV